MQANFPEIKYTVADVEKLVKIQQDKYKCQPLQMMVLIGIKRGYRSKTAFKIAKKFKIALDKCTD